MAEIDSLSKLTPFDEADAFARRYLRRMHVQKSTGSIKAGAFRFDDAVPEIPRRHCSGYPASKMSPQNVIKRAGALPPCTSKCYGVLAVAMAAIKDAPVAIEAVHAPYGGDDEHACVWPRNAPLIEDEAAVSLHLAQRSVIAQAAPTCGH